MSSNTPENTPEPQPEKSQLVVFSLILIGVAFCFAIFAIAVPSLATLAVVSGLSAVLMGVLSLREL